MFMIFIQPYVSQCLFPFATVKSIWKPEVYFPNAKEADFQFVTVPNVLVRINPHGEILYMLRYVDQRNGLYSIVCAVNSTLK